MNKENFLLMIDNFDSFTYNLVHYFLELKTKVQVVRNNAIDIDSITKLSPEKIVISPGPCTPKEAGISLDVVKHFSNKTPILGVCLGHQCIGQVFGGQIVHAKKLMHGKTSYIYHNETAIFADVPNPFLATRYHSLVIDKSAFPDDLEIIAWTQDENGEIEDIMAVKHKSYKIYGVQFHPESILSEHGHQLLKNFLAI